MFVEPKREAFRSSGAECLAHLSQCGRSAGMRTVAALWGPVPRAELELENPDVLAESLEALLEI